MDMMNLEDLFNQPEELVQKVIDQEIVSRIRQRRRQLMVHSYLYYRMNINIVSDHDYDAWALELIDLQTRYPEESEATEMYEDFKGFQMGDSYGLPIHEPWVRSVAEHILAYHKAHKE